MKLFTAHEPKGMRPRDERAAEKVVFVKDGLAWPALFFPVIWILWHRLWLGLLLYALAFGVLGAVAFLGGLSNGARMALFLLPNLWLWLGGNDLRRTKLARRGLVQTAAVMGKDRDEAEQRFFAAWVRADATLNTAPRTSGSAFAVRPAEPAILGVFPEPGGLR